MHLSALSPASPKNPAKQADSKRQGPSHRQVRMKIFFRMRQTVKKKNQMERRRIARAIRSAISVPFEFSDLRSTYSIQHGKKVYLYIVKE